MAESKRDEKAEDIEDKESKTEAVEDKTKEKQEEKHKEKAEGIENKLETKGQKGKAKKCKAKNTMWFLWFLIAEVFIIVLYTMFLNTEETYLTQCLLIFSSMFLLLSISLYESKLHISMTCIFGSELFYVLATVARGSGAFINNDFIISVFILASAIILTVKAFKKENKKITVKNLMEHNMQPLDVRKMILLIIALLVITVVFSVTNGYRTEVSYVTWQAVLFTIAPTIILLLTVVPIKEVVYIRVLYYVFSICIVQMAYKINGQSLISAIEPFIYSVTIVVGRIYAASVWGEAEDKKIRISGN